jgi:hypothetical protein
MVICPNPEDSERLTGLIEVWDADVAQKENIAFIASGNETELAWSSKISSAPDDSNNEEEIWAQVVFSIVDFNVMRHKDTVVADQLKPLVAQTVRELKHINETVDAEDIPRVRESGIRRLECLKTYSPGVNQGIFRVKILGVRLWSANAGPSDFLVSSPPSTLPRPSRRIPEPASNPPDEL